MTHCHGYVNACVCVRCQDRQLRFVLHGDSDRAERESVDYFKTPWRFDNGEPPLPLMLEEEIVQG